MQKLSQTEELARSLAAKARRHTLTPEQISRAMEETDFDVAQLDELYAALEQRGSAGLVGRYAAQHPEVRIIQIALGIFGYTYGSLLGIFLLGMLTRT